MATPHLTTKMRAGDRFGHWTLMSDVPSASLPSMRWCRCDCGAERLVPTERLERGLSQSCGCQLNQGDSGPNTACAALSR